MNGEDVGAGRAERGRWPLWIAATALGYAAGFAAWQSVGQALKPLLSPPLGGTLLLVGFGATVGACAGLAQALARRQRPGRSGALALASLLGWAVGVVASAWLSLLIGQGAVPGAGLTLADAVTSLQFGGVVGACVGLMRRLVLGGRGFGARRWIVASALGLAVGYAAAIGVLELLPPLDVPLLGAAFGACAGAVTAVVEWLAAGRLPA